MRWYGFLFLAVARNATLHAATAERSAAAAERAAKVASQVASHSAEMHENARQALKHAHAALHDAESNSGLTASQKASLEKADDALQAATKKVNAEQKEQVDWVNEQLAESSAAESSREATDKLEAQIRDLEKLLTEAKDKQDAGEESEYDAELKTMKKKLDEQLKSENASEGPGESAGKMRDELEKMQRQLDTMEDIKRLKAKVDGREPAKDETGALRKEMQDLEEMLGKLDAEGGSNVDELADELKRLKQSVIGRIKREDELNAARDEAKAAAAAKAEKPRRSIGAEMPYGELEPFGREDTAQELTDDSLRESDQMVDQIEKAEVAEEKRAVFRSLTRLRGAAITSFDGIARSQTGNIDEYAHSHQWRGTHPLHHLADEESDVKQWAFPNAD